jgi:hypothetical protein
MLSRTLYAAVTASLLTTSAAQAFDRGVPPAEILRLLEHTKFHIVRRTSAIPVQPLIRAKFLPGNRPPNSFLADSGQRLPSREPTRG